jgi:hypothetical protein
MKLFLDGALLGTTNYSGSYSAIKLGERFRLGRSVVDDEPLVDAQLAEVRVWKVARTEMQIRQAMFQRLSGREPGLAGLWNFGKVENGIVSDSGPALHHGKLIGSAKVVSADYPGAAAVRSSKVLELDGNGSYVELPPDIFNNLEEATVEGWVKWETLASRDSMFFCSGAVYEAMYIGNYNNPPTLRFVIFDANGRRQALEGASQGIPGSPVAFEILETNQWYHLAAVSGKGGMHLFQNGLLVDRRDSPSSFTQMKRSRNNYLGKSTWPEANFSDFHGQMDEVRIWKVARNAEQIRENMASQLTGREPGLLGLWNFDDPMRGCYRFPYNRLFSKFIGEKIVS